MDIRGDDSPAMSCCNSQKETRAADLARRNEGGSAVDAVLLSPTLNGDSGREMSVRFDSIRPVRGEDGRQLGHSVLSTRWACPPPTNGPFETARSTHPSVNDRVLEKLSSNAWDVRPHHQIPYRRDPMITVEGY